MAAAIRHFESQQCSRCGGTGTYSWTQRFGSMCFRCGGTPHQPGTGYTLTKLGHEAREAWVAANTDATPASALQAGDTIRTSDGRLRKVQAVELGNWGRSKSGDGPWVEHTHLVRLIGSTAGHIGQAETPYDRWTLRVGLPPEMDPGTPRKAEMRALIAQYAAVAR